MLFEKRDPFSSSIYFEVDVKNTVKGLVVTVLKNNLFYRKGEDFVQGILNDYLPHYSRLNVKSKVDRKKLIEHFREQIQKNKEENERLEMLIKIASRKQVELIDESKK